MSTAVRLCGECPMELNLELLYPNQPLLSECECGYQICFGCWNSLVARYKKGAVGTCPACGKRYDKARFVSRLPRPKPKAIAFTTVTVRGIPLKFANDATLMSNTCFGKYGKVTKVSIARKADGEILFYKPSICFEIEATFEKKQNALQCIKALNGFKLDGSQLVASYAIGSDYMDRGGDEFPAPLLDDTDEVVPNERGASNRGQSISGIRVDAEVADALKMDDCCG
ncbi:uncharacterized protein LOC125198259 isoform X2 [Salvia hispanica]|nr:uncharacterized protein LOC125198259 isoform X2 [Salvia hispanica]